MISARYLLLPILCSAHLCASDLDWPEFRGPTGQGMVAAKSLPLNWTEETNVRWKTAIHGRAWSSPVIDGNRIWLSSANEKGTELFALCVDAEKGKIIHDLKLFDVENPQYAHPFNSYASPTPVLEPGRVYVTFGSPGTSALDSETGKMLWERRDLQCNHFRGAGSSPILYHDLLIMNFDGSDFQYVIALDKKTGQTVWKTNRSIDFQDLTPEGKPQADGDFRKAFSTPVVHNFGEGPILISHGSKAVYAYEPDTGKELWHVEERRMHSGSGRPSVGLGMIFVSMGHSKSELWAIKPGGSGNVTTSHVVWKLRKNVPTRSSPVLFGDLLFMVDDGGIASCVEAKTGNVVWNERIGGEYSAAPIAGAGRVYFFDQDGRTTVIEAGREFKVLAKNQLSDGFMSSPAVTRNSLILRTKTNLYRID
ncbi:MAG TPA: PQQ-binding-like beta-propeller repeat protein [Verrucomicrobiae bacterium]|nr:PQQ-binding-like beta-propeller repeat protein [Verrucomicrobiae bacterium]